MESANLNYSSRYLGDVINFVQHITCAEVDRIGQFSQTLLHHPPTNAKFMEGKSKANWNGSPLQLLISAHKANSNIRLIGDPAFYCVDPLVRLQLGIEALKATLALGQAEALKDLCLQSIDIILPAGNEGRRRIGHGAIGLALALNKPGAAVYFASEYDHFVAWAKARKWCNTMLPDAQEALRSIDVLARNCHIFGVGLEGLNSRAGRAKLYWRLSCPTALSQFGIGLYEHPMILQFLTQIMEKREFPLRALTFSAGFSLSTGQLKDIKVDVCNKSAHLTNIEAINIIQSCCQTLGLHSMTSEECAPLIVKNALAIAGIGLGINSQQENRLNTYLFQV